MFESALLTVVIVATLGFAFTNGFHDASNSVATAIATGALTPRTAVVLAAVMNALGAAVSTSLAWTIGVHLVSPEAGPAGLLVILAGVLAAIGWNLFTWWRGMPSSSSHALFAGLAGAAVFAPGALDVFALVRNVIVPLLVSPLVGGILAFLTMVAIRRVWADGDARELNAGFRYLQVLSGASVSFGHGLQDGQKSMAVVLLALGLTEGADPAATPWVILSCAAAISLGTLAGGWRVTRTLARRIAPIDPTRGFVAETVSAGVLAVAALVLRAPVSTTHTLVAAIIGTGLTQARGAVRWDVIMRMLAVWLATPFATAGVAALIRVALLPLG